MENNKELVYKLYDESCELHKIKDILTKESELLVDKIYELTCDNDVYSSRREAIRNNTDLDQNLKTYIDSKLKQFEDRVKFHQVKLQKEFLNP